MFTVIIISTSHTDINCQVQRKNYYFEAEREKLREEAKSAAEKVIFARIFFINNWLIVFLQTTKQLLSNERDFNVAEKRKSKLEIDHEQLKVCRALHPIIATVGIAHGSLVLCRLNFSDTNLRMKLCDSN